MPSEDSYGLIMKIEPEWKKLVQTRFNPELLAAFKLKYKGKIIISSTPFGCPVNFDLIHLKFNRKNTGVLGGKALFKTCFPSEEWKTKKEVAERIVEQYKRKI